MKKGPPYPAGLFINLTTANQKIHLLPKATRHRSEFPVKA